ncbi:hypothetical protein [Larkinella terrae]|uniref:Aromatic hydrocarbon degradation protein n=1 Tax=Larkinella terrae TaxID=2025311 RepID=A0A7K0EPM2_9BACT|nr:hypothetical protein [Larkinella terrae]MRS63749.1 hypothetical protein [Larkinella terrae]
MKNSIYIVGLLLYAGTAFGQADIYAGDAFRYSEITQTGTARMRGLGGNHASLGGDMSSTFGNPAGLGFYNRSEISISPSFNLLNSQATYIGTQRTNNTTTPFIGQFGLVLAGNKQNENRRWRRTALGITYNRQVNLANNFIFEGRNNRSSIIDSYIVDANGRNLSGSQIDQAYNQNTNEADFPAAAAYQLYLINGTPTSNTAVTGPPYFRYDASRPTQQVNTYESSGAHSQWTIGYAGNLDDKFYIGASLAISRLRFNYENVYRETVVGGAVFNNYSQTDNFSVTGNGINISLGMIYKLDRNLQLGAYLSTPTFSSVKESFEQSLKVDVKDPSVAPVTQNEVFVVPNNFDYSLTTPFRASGGLTYFLGSGRLGFITATADYVGYAGMRVTTNVYDAQGNTDFKNDVKRAVQGTYLNVVNLRAGAEIRAGLLRFRAGVAYLPDAYKEKLNNIDRAKVLISGGLGVRTDRFFVDGSVSYNTLKSAYTPYSLPNASDYASSQISSKLTNITLTAGLFF